MDSDPLCRMQSSASADVGSRRRLSVVQRRGSLWFQQGSLARSRMDLPRQDSKLETVAGRRKWKRSRATNPRAHIYRPPMRRRRVQSTGRAGTTPTIDAAKDRTETERVFFPRRSRPLDNRRNTILSRQMRSCFRIRCLSPEFTRIQNSGFDGTLLPTGNDGIIRQRQLAS